MSVKDRDRLKVLHAVSRRHITQVQAGRELGVSSRWVRTLLLRLKQEGDVGVVHRLRGQISNRKLPERLKQRVLKLFAEQKRAKQWHDYGPTLATEELARSYQLVVSKETLRQWLIAAKLWRARQARVQQAHVWRARRARYGELLQWDTREHDWLEGRGEKLYLIAMIDDATSRLTARFVRHDSTEENLRQLAMYVKQHGRPISVYTDKASLFQMAPRAIHHRDAPEQALTQIGRALKELDIEWIAAHSPQAKGRIERAFQTAQDRRVKGLRQVGAQDEQAANAYLQQVYVPLWNRRFSCEPRMAGDAHRAPAPETNLASVLSIRESRTVGQDHTVQWRGVIYQVEPKRIKAAMRGARVLVERRLDGSVWMHWREQVLALQPCAATPQVRVAPTVISRRVRYVRSAQEKARARQRVLEARRQCQKTYMRLPDRPIWQAMRNIPLRPEGFA